MTKNEIQALLVTIDPDLKHYEVATDGRNFTVWMEYERIVFYADDGSAEKGWKVEINRFTKDEDDPIPDRLEELLEADGRILVKPRRVQYDQRSGYIRHIFDCEAI